MSLALFVETPRTIKSVAPTPNSLGLSITVRVQVYGSAPAYQTRMEIQSFLIIELLFPGSSRGQRDKDTGLDFFLRRVIEKKKKKAVAFKTARTRP